MLRYSVLAYIHCIYYTILCKINRDQHNTNRKVLDWNRNIAFKFKIKEIQCARFSEIIHAYFHLIINEILKRNILIAYDLFYLTEVVIPNMTNTLQWPSMRYHRYMSSLLNFPVEACLYSLIMQRLVISCFQVEIWLKDR